MGGKKKSSKTKTNTNKVNKTAKKEYSREEKLIQRENNIKKQDKLTNWFMINIAYIIIGYFLIKLIEKGYNSTDTILYMEGICWWIFGGFLFVSAVLFALYFTIFKNKTRLRNYGTMFACSSFGGLYLALYNKIRLLVIAVIPQFERINSNFRIWSLLALLGVYTVISGIWYGVKLYKISHSE